MTGGSSGIGLAAAKAFVREGAFVFITGRRESELAAAVKAIGGQVTGGRGDVSNLATSIVSSNRLDQRNGDSTSKTGESRMEQSVEKIIERNMLEVFNGRDAGSRRTAIDELWHQDGVFIDPGGVHEGVENINATAELLFTQFEGYVFSARGPGQSLHGIGRLPWVYGPPDDPQRMTGTDVGVTKDVS